MAGAWATCHSLFFLIVSGMVGAAPAMVPAASAAVTDVPPPTLVEAECGDPAARADMAVLGRSMIAVPVFFGAQALEMGKVSVIAGPYHRGADAILDTLHLFEGGGALPEAIARRWSVDALAFCRTSTDSATIVRERPEALLAQLSRGEVPDWLKPVSSRSHLAIYRLRPVTP